jgi:hypothetical protein
MCYFSAACANFSVIGALLSFNSISTSFFTVLVVEAAFDLTLTLVEAEPNGVSVLIDVELVSSANATDWLKNMATPRARVDDLVDANMCILLRTSWDN